MEWKHPLGPEEEWCDQPHNSPLQGGDVATEYGEGEAAEPIKVRPVLPTPAGMVPVRVNMDLHATFKFWMAHSNFRLTKRMALDLQEVDGVETLDVLTDYRFRVGVGMAFDDEEVKDSIEKLFDVVREKPGEENPNGVILTPSLQHKAKLAKSLIEDDNKYWAFIMLPNGGIDMIRGRNDRQVVASKIRVYRKVQKAVGGVIFKYVERR